MSAPAPKKRPRTIGSQSWGKFESDHCALLAAAISYHVLFAFVPLVTFLMAMFGWLMRDPAARQNVADRLVQMLPLQASQDNLVLTLIRDISAQTGPLTLIGTMGLVWSSAGIFGSIRGALNIAWGVQDKRGVITDFLFDVASVMGFGLLFAASMFGTVALHSMESSILRLPGLSLFGPLHSSLLTAGLLLPALVSFVGFLLLFRFVPNVRHRVRDVWAGACVAALLFEAGKHGFALYVAHFNRYQAFYGALGGVMLFMLWTYVSAITLLIGAEVAAARERRLHPISPSTVGTKPPDEPFDSLRLPSEEQERRAAYMPR